MRVPAAFGDADGNDDEEAVEAGFFNYHAVFSEVFAHDAGGYARFGSARPCSARG